jgi:hypothetical protein
MPTGKIGIDEVFPFAYMKDALEGGPGIGGSLLNDTDILAGTASSRGLCFIVKPLTRTVQGCREPGGTP